MFSTHLKTRHRWLGGGLVLLPALSVLVLAPAGAGAAPTTKMVTGHFTGTAVIGPSCTSPVGLCIHGTLTGGVKGTFDFTASAVSAPDSRGVVLVNGNSVIQTASGALFTVDSAAVNTTSGSDGEFAGLDEISDGTGSFGSTSGYFQLVGTFSGGVQTGSYTGKLVNP